MNVVFISSNSGLETALKKCFEEKEWNFYECSSITKSFHNFFEHKIDAVILDCFKKLKTIAEIKILLKENIKKIIVLENGNNYYLNNNVEPPYSVYKEFKLKNKLSRDIRKIENIIKEKINKCTFFRISELYGPNINLGLIYRLFHEKKITLNEGVRDFVYEGDLIHAIEIALVEETFGIFDIANGKSEDLKEKVVKLVNKYRKNELKVRWRSKENILYNCENFKYYKWEPLVNIEIGLKTSKKLTK